MENINLGNVIEEVISKFLRNRIGAKPPVFVAIPPALRDFPWEGASLKEFVRIFLYETLLTNHPDAPLEVVVYRRDGLKDLEEFVGVNPLYWVQLRIASNGLRIFDRLVEEMFNDAGYRCDEWVGVENSNIRLAIFTAVNKQKSKMVFCTETRGFIRRCDLLLPVSEGFLCPICPANTSNIERLPAVFHPEVTRPSAYVNRPRLNCDCPGGDQKEER